MHHGGHAALGAHLDVLANGGIGTEIERQPHEEAEQHLPHDFVAAGQSVLVLLIILDVVVEETEQTEPHGRHEHQYHINVAQSAQQEAGYEDCHDDNDAAHGGHVYFLHAEGVDAGIALHLADVVPFHPFDEIFAKPRGNHECQYQRQQRAERDVTPKPGAGHAKLFEKAKEIVEHNRRGVSHTPGSRLI